MINRSGIISELKVNLTNLFTEKGFQLLNQGESLRFLKQESEGDSIVVITVKDFDPVFEVLVTLQTRNVKIAEHLIRINNISQEFKDEYPVFSVSLFDSYFGLNELPKIQNEQDLERCIINIKEAMLNYGFNFLQRNISIKDIDGEINRMDRPIDLFCSELRARPFIGIIAAKLSENSNYDVWVDYYSGYLQDKKERFYILFKNLENELN